MVVSSFSGHFSAGEGRGEVREILHGAGIFGGAAGVWGGKKGVKPQGGEGEDTNEEGEEKFRAKKSPRGRDAQREDGVDGKSSGKKNPRGAGMLSGKARLMERVRAKKFPAGRGCSAGRRESSFNPHEGSMMGRDRGQESRARLQETQARGQERWLGGSSSWEICEAGRALRAFRRVCFRGLRGG